MRLLESLRQRSCDPSRPFLRWASGSLSLRDVLDSPPPWLPSLCRGDTVALIGGFDAVSISTLLHLLDAGMIVAPLTADTQAQHDELFRQGHIGHRIIQGRLERLQPDRSPHPALDSLRKTEQAGLILFTSGTTGPPKAILHAAGHFLARYCTPRPALRTLAFLLFDHIGGLNTLLHMLFNNGEVIIPRSRTPEGIAADLAEYDVELLPAGPTFLRMLLLGGRLEASALPALRLVTYGTEIMDQPTLDGLCAALPATDFRQTYGLSELGILRVTSRARNSVWMRIGGEGVETRVENGLLHIRSQHAMLGYLNAPSPLSADGWFATGDRVEVDGPWLRITGREGEIINVGGLKILPEAVEQVALRHPDVLLAKAYGAPNPLTGRHVELAVQPRLPLADPEEKARFTAALKSHMAAGLPAHALPQRIILQDIPLSHRYKKAGRLPPAPAGDTQ